jgi:anti-anti-sigma regulatory factor
MGRGFDQLVLDLRALTFIDSGGVRYVAELARELGDGLTVVPGPPEVQRAFVVLGLDQRIRFAKPRRFMRRP